MLGGPRNIGFALVSGSLSTGFPFAIAGLFASDGFYSNWHAACVVDRGDPVAFAGMFLLYGVAGAALHYVPLRYAVRFLGVTTRSGYLLSSFALQILPFTFFPFFTHNDCVLEASFPYFIVALLFGGFLAAKMNYDFASALKAEPAHNGD